MVGTDGAVKPLMVLYIGRSIRTASLSPQSGALTVHNRLQSPLYTLMRSEKVRLTIRLAQGAGIHELQRNLHRHTFSRAHKGPFALNGSQNVLKKFKRQISLILGVRKSSLTSRLDKSIPSIACGPRVLSSFLALSDPLFPSHLRLMYPAPSSRGRSSRELAP